MITGDASVCANTIDSGAPNAASTRLTSAGGTTAPPVRSCRIEDRSVAAKPGWSSMPMSIVGTPSRVWGRSAAMSSSMRPGSKYGGRISVPQVATAPSTDITHPAVWNNGMALR